MTDDEFDQVMRAAGVPSAPYVPKQPPSLAEYIRLSREQMARDRRKFTGGDA